MGTLKKTVAVVLMLVFMLGGGIGGGYLVVLLAGGAFSVTSAAELVLAVVVFCLLMLSGFVGMCVGILAFMLLLRPFVSKREMHRAFVSDPFYRYPRSTRLLENLLEVIY